MKQVVPELVAWPTSENPSHHKEFLERLQASSSPPRGQKLSQNYNSLFAKWASWCHQRNRNPTTGPVKYVVNFLAELFRQGYKYRSLNSYC